MSKSEIMAHSPVDLAQKLASFSDRWSPKVVARFNECEIMVV